MAAEDGDRFVTKCVTELDLDPEKFMITEKERDVFHTSKKVRTESRTILLVLLTGIIFSFFMALLASLLVLHYVQGVAVSNESLIMALFTVIALCLFSSALYRWYVFAPFREINEDIWIHMIYDPESCSVIEDPFDGYNTQRVASKAFEELKKESPLTAEERMKVEFGHNTREKHVLTELLEYVIFQHFSSNWVSGKGIKRNAIKRLPDGVKSNVFLSHLGTRASQQRAYALLELSKSEYRSSEEKPSKRSSGAVIPPKDEEIKETSPVILPEDVEIKYVTPAPSSLTGEPDMNTFRITLTGKHCDIHLTGGLIRHSGTQILKNGDDVLEFDGVSLNQILRQDFTEHTSRLLTARYLVRIETRLKGVLRPHYGYTHWAESIVDSLTRGIDSPLVDFNEFRKWRAQIIECRIYGSLKLIQRALSAVQNDVSKMNKRQGQEG